MKSATSHADHARHGFTLVELLVVIAIIGVLIGLLLPAVQAAREAVRRLQCQNNLKQIGLALHSYHDVFNSFPHSSTGIDGRNGDCGNGFYSWLAMILPQIEQNNLSDAIDFRLPLAARCDYGSSWDYLDYNIPTNHANALAASTVIPVYLCPSDPGGTVRINEIGETAPGSYAGNIGWPKYSSWPGSNNQVTRQNGVIGLYNGATTDNWHQSKINLKDVTDGTSNTLAVAERKIANFQPVSDAFGSRHAPPGTDDALLSFCGGSESGRPLDRWQTYCGTVSQPDINYSIHHGHAWISGWNFAANHIMPVMPIGKRNCHIYGGEDTANNIITPSGYHSGGVNCLITDGSVRLVQESLDIQTWWALGARDDGQVASLN